MSLVKKLQKKVLLEDFDPHIPHQMIIDLGLTTGGFGVQLAIRDSHDPQHEFLGMMASTDKIDLALWWRVMRLLQKTYMIEVFNLDEYVEAARYGYHGPLPHGVTSDMVAQVISERMPRQVISYLCALKSAGAVIDEDAVEREIGLGTIPWTEEVAQCFMHPLQWMQMDHRVTWLTEPFEEDLRAYAGRDELSYETVKFGLAWLLRRLKNSELGPDVAMVLAIHISTEMLLRDSIAWAQKHYRKGIFSLLPKRSLKEYTHLASELIAEYESTPDQVRLWDDVPYVKEKAS